jgi:hypothetical protein
MIVVSTPVCKCVQIKMVVVMALCVTRQTEILLGVIVVTFKTLYIVVELRDITPLTHLPHPRKIVVHSNM